MRSAPMPLATPVFLTVHLHRATKDAAQPGLLLTSLGLELDISARAHRLEAK